MGGEPLRSQSGRISLGQNHLAQVSVCIGGLDTQEKQGSDRIKSVAAISHDDFNMLRLFRRSGSASCLELRARGNRDPLVALALADRDALTIAIAPRMSGVTHRDSSICIRIQLLSALDRPFSRRSSANFNLECHPQRLPICLSRVAKIPDTTNHWADVRIEKLLRTADPQLAISGAGITSSSRRERPAARRRAEAWPPAIPPDRACSGFTEKGIHRSGVARP